MTDLYKLVVLGKQNAGKTSLIQKLNLAPDERLNLNLYRPDFARNRYWYNSYAGFTNAQLEIWDVPGNMQIRPKFDTLFLDAHAVLLVFDATLPDIASQVSAWMRYAKDRAGNNKALKFYLVGTKGDQVAAECFKKNQKNAIENQLNKEQLAKMAEDCLEKVFFEAENYAEKNQLTWCGILNVAYDKMKDQDLALHLFEKVALELNEKKILAAEVERVKARALAEKAQKQKEEEEAKKRPFSWLLFVGVSLLTLALTGFIVFYCWEFIVASAVVEAVALFLDIDLALAAILGTGFIGFVFSALTGVISGFASPKPVIAHEFVDLSASTYQHGSTGLSLAALKQENVENTTPEKHANELTHFDCSDSPRAMSGLSRRFFAKKIAAKPFGELTVPAIFASFVH